MFKYSFNDMVLCSVLSIVQFYITIGLFESPHIWQDHFWICINDLDKIEF